MPDSPEVFGTLRLTPEQVDALLAVLGEADVLPGALGEDAPQIVTPAIDCGVIRCGGVK